MVVNKTIEYVLNYEHETCYTVLNAHLLFCRWSVLENKQLDAVNNI